MQTEVTQLMQPGRKYSFHQIRKILKPKVVYPPGTLQDIEIKRIIANLVNSGVCEVALDGKEKYVRMIAR